jgi:hypothetical protein
MKIMQKNKANTNPIQTQTKPILANYKAWQSQTKPKQTQFLIPDVCSLAFLSGANPIFTALKVANFERFLTALTIIYVTVILSFLRFLLKNVKIGKRVI